ncbi:MAG: nucleotide exchange factor GrpE [Eubacteriales bacterium]
MKKKSSEKATPEEAEKTAEAEKVETAEFEEVEVIEEKKETEDVSEDKAQLLRILAEYDNFRKRTAKEKIAQKDDVLRQTVQEFLPVYDNLSRALSQKCEDEAFKKGVEMTMTQLQMIFEKLELEKISSVGELFDPKLHEALAREDNENWGENTITEVFVEGFIHKEKVIRFAQVKVAN